MNQLVRFTNAYSGDFVYVAQDKIVSFWAHTSEQKPNYKYPVLMWVQIGPDDNLPVAEEVNYLLSKFPPL